MKHKRFLNEATLNRLVDKSVRRLLREGTTDADDLDKIQYLKDTIGEDAILSCILAWSSSDQIHQWVEWFEEEDYFEYYNNNEM